jgi:NAD(P)H dehydrogenase (quinone)
MQRQVSPHGDNPIHVLVLFYSRFGVLRLLAERIAQGARTIPDVEVTCLEVDEQPLECLRRSRRRAPCSCAGPRCWTGWCRPMRWWSVARPTSVGWPRRSGDCSRIAWSPAAARRPRIARAPGGRPNCAIGSAPPSPARARPTTATNRRSRPYGATAIAGASGVRLPSQVEQEAARALGERVARIATWLKLGRTEWERRQAPRPTDEIPYQSNPSS